VCRLRYLSCKVSAHSSATDGQWNSMGLTSSMGLGVAVARPQQKVIILDGDGTLLMNLNSLTTAAVRTPQNLIHIVWDNRQFELTDGQPTHTTYRADLSALARAAGLTTSRQWTPTTPLKRALGAPGTNQGRGALWLTSIPNVLQAVPRRVRPLLSTGLYAVLGRAHTSSRGAIAGRHAAQGLTAYPLQPGVLIVSAIVRAWARSSGARAGKAEAAVFSSICCRVLAPAITDDTPG
jgi:hypothetical protein